MYLRVQVLFQGVKSFEVCETKCSLKSTESQKILKPEKL